ncbi:hypothetical protein DdX_11808 [Ditylenchus destructor]|uniref:Uncharacterized protein n=1 Tax=Ditylenchus destructor TaxID=166010 RepID=A0AAD4MYM6_9BILA|nr:hypothetical protein DdX_11808 [Ditylenchus destructor]
MASKMLSTAVLATLCLVILMVAVEETDAQYWPYYYYWGKREAGSADQNNAPKQFRGLGSPTSVLTAKTDNA